MNSWDSLYQQNKQMSIYPWTDLVSYVIKYGNINKYENRKDFKVLELGCGVGANISLFLNLGIDYYSIEGSQTAINLILEKYPELINNIKVGDFCKDINFNIEFDLIIDRASVTHNTTKDIKKCLELVHNKLKCNGIFIGIDWFSTNHSDYYIPDSYFYEDDEFTIYDFKQGQFKDVGKTHFSDEMHLVELFNKFNIKILQEKLIENVIPKDCHIFAAWNFVAFKI
jgi:SAM-dependent methyltransferase